MSTSNIDSELHPNTRYGYTEAIRRLSAGRKDTGQNAPAYSRFVNRRIGRYLAGLAYCAGLSPNAVTGISALMTLCAVTLLAVAPPSVLLGGTVGTLLVLGYALDSADGQLARLLGRGSVAGEWLDHMVDALKVSALPLALMVGLFRFNSVPTWWLVVPLVATISGAGLFFGMILTEQLRRQHGPKKTISKSSGNVPLWTRSLVVLPMDYGVLCITFLVFGFLPIFLIVYTLITLLTLCFFILAAHKWFVELKRLDEDPKSGR